MSKLLGPAETPFLTGVCHHVRTGRGHDDLDDIFHSSQTQAPGADNARGGSSIDFLEGFGSATHKPSGGSDPFDVFNSAPQQQRVPLAAGSDDLLGGFEGTLGELPGHFFCAVMFLGVKSPQNLPMQLHSLNR